MLYRVRLSRVPFCNSARVLRLLNGLKSSRYGLKARECRALLLSTPQPWVGERDCLDLYTSLRSVVLSFRFAKRSNKTLLDDR
jgi:hypothetical protein